MSADNGIYILESPKENTSDKEYRVIHAAGIDNIYYEAPEGEEFNTEQLVNYFGMCEVLDEKSAHDRAFKLEAEILSDDFCPILEYGISTIQMDRPFPQKIDPSLGRKKRSVGQSGRPSRLGRESRGFESLYSDYHSMSIMTRSNSDNFHIDVHAKGELQLRLSLDIALSEAPGGKVKAFIKKPWKTSSIAYGKKQELETLILLWHIVDGSTPFPSPLDLNQTLAIVESFLESADYMVEPGHGGSNSHGFRVFNEDWGYVADSRYGIVGIQPCWMMHGK